MEAIEILAGFLVLAFLRYLPPVVLPGLTLLRWAPPFVRVVLALGLAWLTVLAAPFDAGGPALASVSGWVVAAAGELAIGLVFGLVLLVPQGALHMSGWLIDIQAGLGAATLFNPGTQGEMQSMLGSALLLLTTVMFFLLDLHVDLYRLLIASTRVLPLGEAAIHPSPAALLGLLASSFLLALMLVAPVVLGLLVIDFGVAYATRSMPQANVYFLMLPLKIAAALLLLVATLPFVPALLERLYRDAFARAPALLGV